MFPKLEGLSTDLSGTGLNVQVHFSKTGGAPVRYVSDNSEEAAAIREVDLQKKYHRSANGLAEALSLTPPKSKALRLHLAIDSDPSCAHVFVFGASKHLAYSDNAYNRMRDTKRHADMKAIWTAHRSSNPNKNSRCTVEGCKASA